METQILIPLLTLLAFSAATSVRAEVFEIQPLEFGTVLVIDNSTVQNFTVLKNGFVTRTSGIRTMNNNQPAIFRITELNPNSVYNVTVNISAPSMTTDITSDETFTLSVTDFDTTVRANDQGEGEIRVGGAITTSGSGSLNFSNTDFQANFDITIDR